MWQMPERGSASRRGESPTNCCRLQVPSTHVFSLVALMLSCRAPVQTRPSNCRCQTVRKQSTSR